MATRSKADFGYGGHERANEAHDRVEREAYPNRRLRSAYSSIVGSLPTLGPADLAGAYDVLKRIRSAIERGGWTRAEWRRLRDLEAKWSRRASGEDKRFNAVGNYRGGLTRNKLFEIKTSKSIAGIRRMIEGKDGGETD